jgi:hypothetical protein
MFLLKVIFITLLIYYILKFVGKIFLPILFGKVSQNQKDQPKFKQRKQGDVTIFYEDKKSSNSKGAGEYVDYEEVKD